jgi:hypothetical protein
MVIVIIFVIVVVMLWIIMRRNMRENFNLLDTGMESNDCYAKTLDECLNYSNCGIAKIGGRDQCIFGDIEGPTFNNNVDFDQWTYKDSYDKHIFNESDESRQYYTWATFYPIYDVFYPSPTTLAQLF